MRRVTASEATRKRIAEMLRKTGGLDRSDLVRQAARLVIEEALEAEVSEALGRGYYDRGLGESSGQRNGYRCRKLEEAEGRIEYSVPQVRGLPGWQSEVKAALGGGKTEELERLAIEMYARGLSMRDIEAAFTDASGRCVLRRTAASRVAEQLWADYQAFATRSLAEIPIVYLFVDGVAERLHLGQPREAILAAWGIAEDGTKHLLGLLPGTKEDTVSCRGFLRDLKARQLCDPVALITDGAPGLIRAVEEVFPKSLRQRCLVHKLRNVQSKVPEERWPEVIPAAWAIYQAPSSALAQVARDEFVKTWSKELPSAVACFEDDFDACIAHLRLPIAHRRVTRTTSLLERCSWKNGAEQRRSLTHLANESS